MPSVDLARRAIPRPNPAVVHADVSDGAVLYVPETEYYFGLTPVAALIWQLLPSSRTVGDVAQALGARFPDVPLEMLHEDVAELLAELERRNLVIAGEHA